MEADRNRLGRRVIEGDNPVREMKGERQYPEYGGVGDAPFEVAGTIR